MLDSRMLLRLCRMRHMFSIAFIAHWQSRPLLPVSARLWRSRHRGYPHYVNLAIK
jgi:hypothetical protein